MRTFSRNSRSALMSVRLLLCNSASFFSSSALPRNHTPNEERPSVTVRQGIEKGTVPRPKAQGLSDSGAHFFLNQIVRATYVYGYICINVPFLVECVHGCHAFPPCLLALHTTHHLHLLHPNQIPNSTKKHGSMGLPCVEKNKLKTRGST